MLVTKLGKRCFQYSELIDRPTKAHSQNL